MRQSASGAFRAFMPGPSHSIFFPNRMARFPSSTVSVNGPASVKFDRAAGPPRQASIHSASSSGTRGIVRGGSVKPSTRDFGVTIHFVWLRLKKNLPRSPIITRSNCLASCSEGMPASAVTASGGMRPPSYQANSRSWQYWPAGNRQVTVAAFGPDSSVLPSEWASTEVGCFRSSDQ